MLDDLQPIAEILFYAGIGLAGIGYLVSRFISGTDQAESAALSLSRETNEILRQRLTDLSSESGQTKQQLSEANGRLKSLESENAELRSLIMGEKVPEALANYFNDTFTALLKRIETSERVIIGAMRAQVADFKDFLDEKFPEEGGKDVEPAT